MKKLAILFLLITVLVSFSFAQVSLGLDFGLGNVGEGNNGKMDPTLKFKFAGSGEKELGPGSINLAGELQYNMSFQDAAGNAYDLGDNDFRIGYALPAGPGLLGFGLKFTDLGGVTKQAGLTYEPDVSYDGIIAGPAVIGFGAWYDFKTGGSSDSGKKAPFGKYYGFISLAERKENELGFRLSASLADLGLGITYKFIYGLGIEKVAKIVYLDIAYTGVEKLTAGLEVDNTGEKFKGFTLKPYVTYAVLEDLAVGAYFKVDNINGDEQVTGKDMMFTPGITAVYSF
jgi:hypothetical protein